ncbi:(2Fe-2S) ferredoxin domain-containing protein [Nodosilinea sp. LEGE 07088]|uniref:(2Fe-2S) ferredoxin domain-containing protein n=1 Tax=Nodosilinea sp. LEGE 07088 TaxID=2777968 RepID=UPI00188275A7|nr:(2Fe-2S) ferredoxin domain-containing protein [Nodosilinea sp. LEGE 07088]MBE9138908.1 (2Fe-2S) ferredoxin domain-containing protein [Nodosilinea sp. LEGE 07088]
MTTLYEPAVAKPKPTPTPPGQVLKGRYTGAYRSNKGKIKGLLLQVGAEEYTIKLPKYLRPLLVRELTPGEFVQVWAYLDDDRWRAINILSLPDGEAAALPQAWGATAPARTAQPQRLCVEVCTKGKCYKQGGRQIHSALQAAVERNPNLAHVAIKGTGCMKACKHGPNLRLPNGRMLHRVTPAEALAQVESNL